MPRRLQFTNTKNFERKRQAEKKLAKKTHGDASDDIKELHKTINLPQGCNDLLNSSANEIRLCKVSCETGVSSEPLKVSHSIVVSHDRTWSVYVHGKKVPIENSPLTDPGYTIT